MLYKQQFVSQPTPGSFVLTTILPLAIPSWRLFMGDCRSIMIITHGIRAHDSARCKSTGSL